MAKDNYIDVETGQIYDSAESALQAQREKQELNRQSDANKNPPFIQLTKGVSPAILAKVSKENSTAIPVLMFFFENMDDYNVIMVSQQTIAEAIDASPRSVARAIKTLEDNGAIGIGKVGNANVYLINPHIAWQKAYKQRNIVVLKGNILLGRAENEKLFEKFGKVFYDSQDNNLKIDNVATKIVKMKEQPKPKNAQPLAFQDEFEDYDELSPGERLPDDFEE